MANCHRALSRCTRDFSYKDSIISIPTVTSFTRVSLRFCWTSTYAKAHSIDLKPDNIMMKFEDPSVIEDFIQVEAEKPMPRKVKDGRSIYLSHDDFGRLKSLRVIPIIADFGLAERGDGPETLRHPIQPPLYHAPEVILGTGWTYSADIWNLGVLVRSSFSCQLRRNFADSSVTCRFGI